MPEVDSTQPSTQRRRSERVSESLPLIVRGVDLLGQPFEERTSTLAFNLHGCRYASKRHLPKNTWVTLELPQTSDRHNVRARVAWIQRPHSVRELFQIGVELESPSNIWGVVSPPADWTPADASLSSPASYAARRELRIAESSEAGTIPATLAQFMEKLMTDMSNPSPESPSTPEAPFSFEFTPAADSPLLRELRAELERHARQAVETAASRAHEEIRRAAEEIEQKRSATADEFFRRWKEEFERVQSGAREQFTAQLGARQEEFLAGLKSEFEENFGRARALMAELDHKALALRAENEAVHESVNRIAQARLQMEAAGVAHASKHPVEISKEDIAAAESAATSWRQRLASEMTVAQAQWNELLQSSLDSNLQRLAEQLSERSRDILRSAEQKMTERFAELRQPFAKSSEEARETLAEIKSSLDQEVARGWSSLAEIEHAAGRMKDYSGQLEAATHDTLNELHRRLEKILDAHTAEMNHRAAGIVADISQRVTPSLETLGRQFVDRTVAEVESKLAPHVEHVPELLRELAAREVQVEESLRLHRERLRQVSENNQREVASQISATLAGLHTDFEAARVEALAKWSEELDASGVRASHATAESISRASEWFQQEARARLQVQVEQALAAAGSGFDSKTAEAAEKYEAQLAGQSSVHVAQIQQQLDGISGELVGRTRSQFEEAAVVAAASFGHVLRGVSEEETQLFTNASRHALKERAEELERSANHLLRNLEASAGSSLEWFRAQMASQLEASMAEGRSALAAEFATALNGYHAERETHQNEWLASLERMSADAAEKYQERLQTSGDSWMVSSVRRLNEHGQNTIESLTRSAEQSLRDSCSKVFDGLSELLRDRTTNPAGVPGFTPGPARDVTETPTPRNKAISNTSGT
ncbi:MAG: hypothetical protein WBP79_00920 [Candidatus Acidiferrales bacterium]